MKETTGELNATVVVVLAVGVLLTFFYFTLWPMIDANFNQTAQCNSAICETKDEDDDGFVNCVDKDNPDREFECVFKG